MYSKIGNLIWKEMKMQGHSQLQFTKILGIPEYRLKQVFKSEKIDVHLLVQISKVLKKNFFQELAADEMEDLLELESLAALKSKIADLTESINKQEMILQNINKQTKQLQASIQKLEHKKNKF